MLYEYVNARISARYPKLLKKEDFDNILDFNKIDEIVNYLRGKWYAHYINKSDSHFSIDEYLKILKSAFEDEISKIVRFSGKEIEKILRAYLSRWDLYNIITIIRGKWTKAKNDEIIENLMPFGTISRDELQEIINVNEAYEVLDKLVSMGIRLPFEITTQLNKIIREQDIPSAEFYLYKAFYNKVLLSLSDLEGVEPVKRIIGMYVDLRNIISVLILIKDGVKLTNKVQFIGGGNLDENVLNKLSNSENIEEAISILKDTIYGEVIKNYTDINDIERAIENFIYNYTFKIKSVYSETVGPILAYVSRLEAEIMNLRIIGIGVLREMEKIEIKKFIIL